MKFYEKNIANLKLHKEYLLTELNTEKEKFVAGDTVELTVIRGDDTLTISLTLQEDKPVLPEE